MSQVLDGILRTRRRRITVAALVALLLFVVVLLVLVRRTPQLTGKLVYIEQLGIGVANDSALKLHTIPGDSVQEIVRLDAALYQPHWSLDGKRIAFGKVTPFRNGRMGGDIYVVNADGSGLKQLTINLHPSAMVWSPDGNYIAFIDGIDAGSAIYVVDINSGRVKQLTVYATRDLNPVWSPNSTRIAFVSNRDGFQEIYTMKPDGTDIKRLTYTDNLNDLQPDWSPDGKRIAYITQYSVGDGTAELHVMNADGTNTRQLTDNEQGEFEPSWAPDSQHIAYMGGTNTIVNIFIMNVDTGETKQITHAVENDAYTYPRWLPDGRHLLYHNSNRSSASGWIYCMMDIDGKPVTAFTNGCMEGMSAVDWLGQ